MAKKQNWVVTLDWDTGERTRIIVPAWNDQAAQYFALDQIPCDLHERISVDAHPEDQ